MRFRKFVIALGILSIFGCMTKNERNNEIDAEPAGLVVTHTPNVVAGPTDVDVAGWPYVWEFKTEVSSNKGATRIIEFGMYAWDGGQWIIDESQRQYNSGRLDSKEFAEWYGIADSTIRPKQPAVDPTNWAGSRHKKPFKQKWYYIGETEQGERVTGEAVVSFIVDES